MKLTELGAAGEQAKRASLLIYFNYAAHNFDYIIRELFNGQWTEALQEDYKDCQNSISCAQ